VPLTWSEIMLMHHNVRPHTCGAVNTFLERHSV
jgi:hypothetical protein